MNSEDIFIRAATLADVEVLLEFEQGVVAAERPHAINLDDGEVRYYDLPALIKSELAQVLVAQIGSTSLETEVVASGYARIETSKPHNKSERHSYLGFMYVVPEWRGRSLNKLVLDHLVDWSHTQGVSTFVLDVYASNEPAIRAYEKAGFKPNLLQMVLEAPADR